MGLYAGADEAPSAKEVKDYVAYEQEPTTIADPAITDVDLTHYDSLLGKDEEEAA